MRTRFPSPYVPVEVAVTHILVPPSGQPPYPPNVFSVLSVVHSLFILQMSLVLGSAELLQMPLLPPLDCYRLA
jgi:hypothetical protein